MLDSEAYFDIRSKIIFLSAGVLVPLMLFAWAYQSGNRFLSQEIPLVDSIMQLRVDITRTHSQIHEYVEGHQAIEKESVIALINKIKVDANSIHQGYVQMGDISGTVSRASYLQIENDEVKLTVDQLTSYLLGYHDRLEALVEQDEIHDDYFKEAEWAAAEFDHEIHKQFSASLDQQPTLFGVIFAVWLLTLLLMMNLLRIGRIAHAVEFERSMKLAQALEHAGSAIMITDARASIEYVNAAFSSLTGYETAEVVGKKTSMLNSGSQDDAYYQRLWQVIADGGVWRGELWNRKKDGSICPVVMSISPIINRHKQVTHYIASQEDMSQFVAMEERLHMSQKLETAGMLAGGIAHDFNNALAAVKANAHMLKSKPTDAESVIRRASAIDEVCDLAAKHIRQLLSFVRKEKLEMGVISLNACMESACEMASLGISIPVSVDCSISEKPLYVRWNDAQAQQIMINLINNAVHAVAEVTDPGVHVSVSLFTTTPEFRAKFTNMTDRQYASISVKDNGYGIAEDQLDKVFEVFYTTKDAGVGTGLGLSMAYGAVNKIGGLIDVESRVGEGSEFNIYLPLCESSK